MGTGTNDFKKDLKKERTRLFANRESEDATAIRKYEAEQREPEARKNMSST